MAGHLACVLDLPGHRIVGPTGGLRRQVEAMSETDSPRVDLSWPALMRRAHAVEHAEDWQYAVVWRFAAEGDPVDLDDLPPEGAGWERNGDRADDGREVRVPTWSDGSKVMHLSYWRRKSPGMKPWHTRHKLHEQRDGHPS